MSYLNFIADVIKYKHPDSVCIYRIINDKQEEIGTLEKMQVGRWQSWCLFLNKDCYASASCLDEIREKIRSLNNNKLKVMR